MSGNSDRGSKQKQASPQDETFLSRWSRRKVEGAVIPEVAAPAAAAPDVGWENPSKDEPASAKMAGMPHQQPMSPASSREKPELPSIESLTPDADFSPFMAKDVDPSLRNQAMKKLFADPHYGFDNMDKLDIYIDDYSKPDPIPIEMLKKMYQSKSLGLFDDAKETASEVDGRALSGAPGGSSHPAAELGHPPAQEMSAPDLQGGQLSDPSLQSDSAPLAATSAGGNSANNHKKIKAITRADIAANDSTAATDNSQSQ